MRRTCRHCLHITQDETVNVCPACGYPALTRLPADFNAQIEKIDKEYEQIRADSEQRREQLLQLHHVYEERFSRLLTLDDVSDIMSLENRLGGALILMTTAPMAKLKSAKKQTGPLQCEPANLRRLEFIRWLVDNGRISDY